MLFLAVLLLCHIYICQAQKRSVWTTLDQTADMKSGKDLNSIGLSYYTNVNADGIQTFNGTLKLKLTKDYAPTQPE